MTVLFLGLDYSMLSNHLVELLKTVYVSEVKKDQFKWKFKKNEMISFMSIDRKKLLHNNWFADDITDFEVDCIKIVFPL